MLEINKIYNMDCLEGMKLIDDDSIDLICIDPPYNIGKAKWDKIDDYIEWMGKVFKECERILKDNGSFYFFHNDFLRIVELQNWINNNTEFRFKQFIVWDKYNGSKWNQLNAIVYSESNRNYSKQAEYCLYYTFQDETGLNKIFSNKSLFKPIKEYLKLEKNKSGLTNKEFNLIFSEYTNKKGCINRSVIEHYWSTSQWFFPTKGMYENVLQKQTFLISHMKN